MPVARMIREVLDDPAIPRFGRNQPGMRADADLDASAIEAARLHWLDARDDAVERARELAELGAAKESVNRLVEPFGWFDAVISATDFLNFFALRIHPDAQAEIRELAVLMARAYRDSAPVAREVFGTADRRLDWHLPYVTEEERASLPLAELRDIGAARCGRVSYVPHDSEHPDVAKDLARAGRMARERHAVPFEHVASPAYDPEYRSGNFRGWVQYRQQVPGNVATGFDWSLLDRWEPRP